MIFFFFGNRFFMGRKPNTLSCQQLVRASEPPASCHSAESEATSQSPAKGVHIPCLVYLAESQVL